MQQNTRSSSLILLKWSERAPSFSLSLSLAASYIFFYIQSIETFARRKTYCVCWCWWGARKVCAPERNRLVIIMLFRRGIMFWSTLDGFCFQGSRVRRLWVGSASAGSLSSRLLGRILARLPFRHHAAACSTTSKFAYQQHLFCKHIYIYRVDVFGRVFSAWATKNCITHTHTHTEFEYLSRRCALHTTKQNSTGPRAKL